MTKTPEATVIYDELGNICRIIIGGKDIPTCGLVSVHGNRENPFADDGYLNLKFHVASVKSRNKSADDYKVNVTIRQEPGDTRRIYTNGVEVPGDNLTEVKIIERPCEMVKIVCTYETDNLIMEGPHD